MLSELSFYAPLPYWEQHSLGSYMFQCLAKSDPMHIDRKEASTDLLQSYRGNYKIPTTILYIMNFAHMNRQQISFRLVPWLIKAKHWKGIRLCQLFRNYINYLLTASINFSSITVSMWDSANISRWLRHWFHASKLPCCFECFLSRRATVCNNFAVRYCTNIIQHKS